MTDIPRPAPLHWRDREARGIPDDPPVWTPEQWKTTCDAIRAKQSGAPTDPDATPTTEDGDLR
jgi:hypothetical protein